MQKALLADPADPKGLLASLDRRFAAAAKTLDLRAKGLDALKDPALQKQLTDGYVEYQYRIGLDDRNAGLSDALYFLKNAASQKDIYGILGNSVMRRVVTGALGLPAGIAVQSVETQARAVTTRLKLADLQDPKKVQQLAQRYVTGGAQAGSGSLHPGSAALSCLTPAMLASMAAAKRSSLPRATSPHRGASLLKGRATWRSPTTPDRPRPAQPRISPPAPAPSGRAGRWRRSRARCSAAATAPPGRRRGSPR